MSAWGVIALCAALTAGTLEAAGPVATVRGAEALNVRRGPGADAPAFAVLARGAQVTVEERDGDWVLVVLASGERGYVHGAFLELPAGAAVATAVPSGIATDTATPPPTDTPLAPLETPPTRPLEDKLARVLERVAALESVIATPSALPDPSATAAENAPPRGIEPLITPGLDRGDLQGIAPALALAGVGFVVGFLLGAAYGQRQERNRRTRVRF